MEEKKKIIRIFYRDITELRKQAWAVYEGVDNVYKGKTPAFRYDSQNITRDLLQ